MAIERDDYIRVRMSTGEKNTLARLASLWGTTMSGWVRSMIYDYIFYVSRERGPEAVIGETVDDLDHDKVMARWNEFYRFATEADDKQRLAFLEEVAAWLADHDVEGAMMDEKRWPEAESPMV